MTDAVTATGISVETNVQIVSDLTTGLQDIYGDDISVDQNSPDGQLIGIFAQACTDVRELAVQIYNNFDPDQATGTVLDQRVAINNIQRQGGTFTIQPIDITVSTTVTLQGLDANFNSLTGTGYTLQDNSGNQWILLNTVTLTAGLTTLNFRAAQIGLVQPITNSITNQVTVILGVTSVNNSAAPLTVGQNQETDAQLRLRRAQSTAIGSTGYANGLLGAVLGLTGVIEAVLYNNRSNVTDGNGIPAHGIWLIVDGGSSSDIANTMYKKISDGANMKGSVTYNIITPSNEIFTAMWDVPVAQRLYVKFNLKKIISTTTFNTAAIAAAIAASITFSISQAADMGTLTQLALNAVQANGGGGLVLDLAVSINGTTWFDYIATTTLAGQFTLAAGDIAITVE
jgi:uncharacterized phage protein gp47/JayE